MPHLAVVLGLHLTVRVVLHASAQVTQTTADHMTGGGGFGVLGATPDGTAVALHGYLDYFFAPALSVGPFAQVGMTGAMTLFGLSGQLKYWIDLPETGNRGKVVLQGGFGFAQATHRGSDASWLIPLGATLDWALAHQQASTATFLE